MEKQIRIKNFGEYIEIINELSKGIKKSIVHDDVLLFRGHSDVAHQLIPSIARTNKKTGYSYLYYEKEMISKAIGKNPGLFHEDEYAINLLVKLQHFGIPTRLLDVTYNALVALYFACKNDKDLDQDGEVFVFKISSDDGNYIKYFNDPYVDLISKTYKKKGPYPYEITTFLGDAKYQLGYIANIDNHIRSVSCDTLESVIANMSTPIFVSPVELSERQKNQQGAFILFPNELRKKSEGIFLYGDLVKMQKENDIIVKQIIIPKENKIEMLKYLENYGIREEFLFPDSPDIICKTITEGIQKRIKE